jgi:hypothetical protein
MLYARICYDRKDIAELIEYCMGKEKNAMQNKPYWMNYATMIFA